MRRPLALIAVATASLAGLSAFSRRANRRFEELELEDVVKPGHWLEIEGVRLHYVDSGRGPALVLLHGLGDYVFAFRRVIPELARHFRWRPSQTDR